MANQITLITPLNSYMFLSELKRITFSSLYTYANVVITIGDVTVLDQKYFVDDSGCITLYDIDKLVWSYMDDNSTVDIKINIGGAYQTTITVIYANASISESAQDFIPDFFLTPVMTERDITLGRIDLLPVYTLEETSVDAVCTYYKDGETVTDTVHIATVDGLDLITVNPSAFDNILLGVLTSFTVVCGKRKAAYRVLYAMAEADPMVLYRNCFNCWEAMYLTGAKESEPSFTRSSTTINGRLRNYDIVETRSYKAMTGPVRNGLEVKAYDLARSLYVFLMNADGSAGDEIVITDCDIKYTNEDNEIPDFTFTYRLAERYTDKIATVRPPRVFDATFDEQFE
jgi:hypothetical protein